MTTQEYLAARKSKNWKFNQVVNENAFKNVNRIHPLKQKMVAQIVDHAKKGISVRRVIIFGSSTRYDCDITSDLDICIDWNQDCYDKEGVLKPFTKNMRQIISSVTRGNADVVDYAYLNKTVLTDAVENGVIVYDITEIENGLDSI